LEFFFTLLHVRPSLAQFCSEQLLLHCNVPDTHYEYFCISQKTEDHAKMQ